MRNLLFLTFILATACQSSDTNSTNSGSKLPPQATYSTQVFSSATPTASNSGTQNTATIIPTPSPPSTITPSPTGKILYVGDFGQYGCGQYCGTNGGTVNVMAIESDGSLSFLQKIGPFTYGVSYISMDTQHNNLYLGETDVPCNQYPNCTIMRIMQYAIDFQTGMLTAVNLNQSIFAAQSAGATFNSMPSSATNAGVTFSISGLYVSSSTTQATYQAGLNPISLLVR